VSWRSAPEYRLVDGDMVFARHPRVGLRAGYAAAVPEEYGPADALFKTARARALHAAGIAIKAAEIDPTLMAQDRCRSLDLLWELQRQLKPLARQARAVFEHRRLTDACAPVREIAKLGRINKAAPAELDALSIRTVEIAKEIEAAALPDWDTPARILERSESLLPSGDELRRIARQLRQAVEDSLSLASPAPQAVRLARLADQIEENADD
jgi:hypothetical protein